MQDTEIFSVVFRQQNEINAYQPTQLGFIIFNDVKFIYILYDKIFCYVLFSLINASISLCNYNVLRNTPLLHINSI